MGLLIDTLLNPAFGVMSEGTERDVMDSDLQIIRRWASAVPKFVLNDKATRFVQALPAQMPSTTVPHVKMPYGAFWMETAWETMPHGGKNRYGILFMGFGENGLPMSEPDECVMKGDLSKGSLTVAVESGYNTIILNYSLDFADATKDEDGKLGPIVRMAQKTYTSLRTQVGGYFKGHVADSEIDDIDETILDFMQSAGMIAAAFGMSMAAKGVAERREVDFIKLNRQRAKGNKPPLANHTVINITLDPPGVKHVSGPRDPNAPKGRKREHFVRFFTRIVNHKLQSVTPHKRGDPSLGTKQPTYKVK